MEKSKIECVRTILNALFKIQIDDGWPVDEGLRGLSVGKSKTSQDTASWGDWSAEFDPLPPEYLMLDGTYTVSRRGKTYNVEIKGDDFHIKRIV